MVITVYVLHHVHSFEDGSEDVKLIGVYASHADAQAAIERLKNQPGFVEQPDGFHIGSYPLGKDHWPQGYVTVTYDDDPVP